MTATTETVKAVDMPGAINYVAYRVAMKFRRWVSVDDLKQDLNLYVIGGGKKHLDAMVAEGDRNSVYRTLFSAARIYAETEKAAQSGYSFEDVAWYNPSKLADIIPMALDPKWEGLTGESNDSGIRGQSDGREGGTLLAMVADTRKALGAALGWAKPADFDPDTDLGMERLSALSEKLGGEFPNSPGYQRGRRRAMSNATANVITHDQEDGQ